MELVPIFILPFTIQVDNCKRMKITEYKNHTDFEYDY